MAQKTKSSMNTSKIIGIQFSVLSPEEIRKGSVAEITSRDTYINNKPVINGLFDPRMGVLEPGLVCPTDGLNYMQTPGYFGHINLARPVYYIQYLTTILKVLRCVCFKCSKLKINKETHDHILNFDLRKRWEYAFAHASKIKRCGDETSDGCGCKQPRKIYKQDLANLYAEWDNVDGVPNSDGTVKDKLTMKLTPEMVLKIFRRISDEDVSFMGFSPIWSRPEWFICQVLAVPPPSVRPSVKHDSQQRSEDDISHIIVNIIKANKTLLDKLQSNALDKVIEDWTTVLQYYVATMVDNRIPGVAAVAQRSGRALKSIKERLVGKQGRVRGNLMGKRVDFSARSVITPDANLSISELGVPLKIAKNITFPTCVNDRNKSFLLKLVINGPEKYPGANVLERKSGESVSLKYVDRNTITLNNGDIVHRHMVDGDPVLFNRQPTLHRMSMMCHIARVMKVGNTFRMNVADTKPYNADFDGDEMNLHQPQDEESQAELMYLAAVPLQIISPQNNASIVGIFQDSMLGSARFTRENINFDVRQAMNLLMYYDNVNPTLFKDHNKKISSFEILSQILPPLSTRMKNGVYGEGDAEEDNKTSNNIIEIVNGKYIRGQLDKGALGKGSKGLLQTIFNDFNYKESADFIDNLQSIITEYMKLSSYSVGISDLIADNETNKKITSAVTSKKKDVENLIDQLHLGVFENSTGKSNEVEFETKVNGFLNAAAKDAGKIGRTSLSPDNRFVIMVNAGSKGNVLNIAQMVSCLGQQNVDGKRIPYGFEDRTLPHYTKFNDSPEARGFVESSFIQGLTPEEVYFHAMGGRVGLIDTAVKTSQTGYIQRRLIKGQEDLKVAYDMTVRNNKNKIIQFRYGDDNINPMKTENQQLPLAQMSLEEIYSHMAIPEDDTSKSIFTTTYEAATLKRIKKQKTKLKKKTSNLIMDMIEYRKKLTENVFKNEKAVTVHIPVHFERIINNLQHQLHIQPDFVVNITPLEIYELIDDAFDTLNQHELTKPTDLFKLAWYFYLTPKELLMVRRFNRKAIVLLLETLILNYHKALVHPGEMVGMVSAQSIGEPTTQMTLNTFHFAGVASKSNVTRGVPRIEEILSLSENPKQPSTTIYLKQNEQTKLQRAQEIKYSLEYTSIRDIAKSISICFDPKPTDTLIDDDRTLISEYIQFNKIMEECGANTEDLSTGDEFSKWIIRIELSKEEMMDRNVTMDDIHFALTNSLKNQVECVFSDLNADNLIFRIRLVNSKALLASKKKGLDQTDEIYMLKNLQDNILNNIILKGIKGIPKIIIRTIKNYMVEKDGNYVPEDIWVLDTVGSNLKEILAIDYIDTARTYSNDIREIYRTLGIEAARQCIYNELAEAFSDTTYINYHHMSLLCDRMCATQKMVSIFRHGINNDDIGPIAKASFEETPEMFLRAARHAELDIMTGVSSNIMCGQEGYYGTGSFQVLLNMDEMNKLGAAKLEQKINIDDMLQIENPNDVCSKKNITINSSSDYINSNNTGTIDDDYELDF
jgi:DNA-directed RNA polymerase II subunit RPB1